MLPHETPEGRIIFAVLGAAMGLAGLFVLASIPVLAAQALLKLLKAWPAYRRELADAVAAIRSKPRSYWARVEILPADKPPSRLD